MNQSLTDFDKVVLLAKLFTARGGYTEMIEGMGAAVDLFIITTSKLSESQLEALKVYLTSETK